MPAKVDNRHKDIGGKHRALTRYYLMLSRCNNTHLRKNRKYAGVKVLVGKDEFVAWFMERDFTRCSVDRIDPSGNYELSNMRVIGLSQNIAKDKLIARDGMCRCWRCCQEKPIDDFVKDSRRKFTGRSTICKPCEVERTSMKNKKGCE